jgi:hypothetical protein
MPHSPTLYKYLIRQRIHRDRERRLRLRWVSKDVPMRPVNVHKDCTCYVATWTTCNCTNCVLTRNWMLQLSRRSLGLELVRPSWRGPVCRRCTIHTDQEVLDGILPGLTTALSESSIPRTSISTSSTSGCSSISSTTFSAIGKMVAVLQLRHRP